ncbi:MAG: hypothetical protein OXU26_16310 [Acidobacteriota bacterium]|nr:hypothetical protein [Acidobacteriota bacterium]
MFGTTRKRIFLFGLVLPVLLPPAVSYGQTGVLPGTAELTWEGDLSARMVAGIDRFLMRRLEAARNLFHPGAKALSRV